MKPVNRAAWKRAYGLATVADMFEVSRDTMKRLAGSGELKTITVAGRRLVPASEVERVEREGIGRKRS